MPEAASWLCGKKGLIQCSLCRKHLHPDNGDRHREKNCGFVKEARAVAKKNVKFSPTLETTKTSEQTKVLKEIREIFGGSTTNEAWVAYRKK
jgi:hypothetical protein